MAITQSKKEQCLQELKELPEDEFQEFYDRLPQRVKLVCGNLCSYEEVLPEWYAKYKQGEL